MNDRRALYTVALTDADTETHTVLTFESQGSTWGDVKLLAEEHADYVARVDGATRSELTFVRRLRRGEEWS